MKAQTIVALAMLSSGSTFAATCPDLLNHKFATVNGQEVNLCEFADRPILVVNTASRCGFTPQFTKLQALHEEYQAKGLVVVGFPSNDFRQELGTNKEVGEFCLVNYGVQFPMIEKTSVKGVTANPLFKQLAAATGQEPGWNFHKYLIAPGGTQVYSFATRVEPDAPEIMGKLKPMLK